MKYSATILVFFCLSAFGQKPEVRWSEPNRKSGQLVYMLPKDSTRFFALRWTGSRLFGSYQVTEHEQLNQIESTRIRLVADKSVANFEGARVFNGKFITFLSDKRNGFNHIYYQPFNEDLKPDGEAIQLASYEMERVNSKGDFSIEMSADGQFMGVIWEIPGRKGERDYYGFKVFDQNLNVVNEGEYPLPYDAELSVIHAHHISNKGDYFMALSELQENTDRRIFEDKYIFKALHIYHISDEGLQDYQLDMGEDQVVAMSMISDENDVFTITGIYGARESTGVKGVFIQKANVKKGEVIMETSEAFSEDFITQGWTDREVRRSERREERGRGVPQFYNYKMRGASIQEDGSVVGMMEQFYVQVRSYADPASAQSNNSYYYYYNDIIAYRVDSAGSLSWFKKIPKFQVSSNDGGPFSSYEAYIDDTNAYFIFNDNVRNYDSDGNFIPSDRVHAANFGRNRNIVGHVTMNLNSGETKRESFFGGNAPQGLVVPKKFNVDYNSRQVLLYSLYGNKERFGLLKF